MDVYKNEIATDRLHILDTQIKTIVTLLFHRRTPNQTQNQKLNKKFHAKKLVK